MENRDEYKEAMEKLREERRKEAELNQQRMLEAAGKAFGVDEATARFERHLEIASKPMTNNPQAQSVATQIVANPKRMGMIMKILGILFNIITLGFANKATATPTNKLRYLVFKYSAHYPCGGISDLVDGGDDLAALLLKHRNPTEDSAHIYDTTTQEIIIIKDDVAVFKSIQHNNVTNLIHIKE